MKNFLMFLCLGFLLQSCVSNKGFQTARVTPVGETGWGIGMTLPSAEFFDDDGNGNIIDTTDLGGFTGEIFLRRGITEKIDVGFNLSLLGTSGGDIKYQFLGDSESPLAGSIGAGVSYLSFGSDSEDASTSILDITIPAYFSYHPSNAFSVYASPRFIYRSANGSSSNFGILGGIRVGGERSGLFAEYGYLRSNDDFISNVTSLNIGFGIGIR